MIEKDVELTATTIDFYNIYSDGRVKMGYLLLEGLTAYELYELATRWSNGEELELLT